MLKDWDAFERLPEIDQVLLLEATGCGFFNFGSLRTMMERAKFEERVVAPMILKYFAR